MPGINTNIIEPAASPMWLSRLNRWQGQLALSQDFCDMWGYIGQAHEAACMMREFHWTPRFYRQEHLDMRPKWTPQSKAQPVTFVFDDVFYTNPRTYATLSTAPSYNGVFSVD